MISESGMTEMLLTNKSRCVKINKLAGFGDTFATINMDYTITFLIESDKGENNVIIRQVFLSRWFDMVKDSRPICWYFMTILAYYSPL